MGSTAPSFNVSVVVYGVTAAFIGVVCGRRTLGALLMLTLALSGAHSTGVGLFPEIAFISPLHLCVHRIFPRRDDSDYLLQNRIVHRRPSLFSGAWRHRAHYHRRDTLTNHSWSFPGIGQGG